MFTPLSCYSQHYAEQHKASDRDYHGSGRHPWWHRLLLLRRGLRHDPWQPSLLYAIGKKCASPLDGLHLSPRVYRPATLPLALGVSYGLRQHDLLPVMCGWCRPATRLRAVDAEGCPQQIGQHLDRQRLRPEFPCRPASFEGLHKGYATLHLWWRQGARCTLLGAAQHGAQEQQSSSRVTGY